MGSALLNVVAKEIRKRLITRLIESDSKFIIIIDELITMGTKCTLIVRILCTSTWRRLL